MSVLAILAVVAGVVGIVGSVIPGLPGPPLSWLGMLLAYFAKGTNGSGDPMTTRLLIIWLAVTVIVTVLDYIIPAYFTRLTGGSKVAARGAIAGLFISSLISSLRTKARGLRSSPPSERSWDFSAAPASS